MLRYKEKEGAYNELEAKLKLVFKGKLPDGDPEPTDGTVWDKKP